MPVFLSTVTISSGRIALGTAGVRNLRLQEGDKVDIFFDETHGALVIKPAEKEPEEEKKPPRSKQK